MALDVVDAAEHDKWLDVLSMCSLYDFYHCPSYHEIAVTNERYEKNLFVYQEGAYTIAIPLVIRPLNEIEGLDFLDFRDATSVYGYAGPIASHEFIPEEVIKNFQAGLQAHFRNNGIICAFSRLHPLIIQQHLLEDFGSVLSAGHTVSIDLSLPPDEQYSHYRRNHKYNIRKLRQLNMRCIEDQGAEHLDGFMGMYYENMRRVHAQTEYFFDKVYFQNILNTRDFEMRLFVCLLDDDLICGGLFSLCNGIVQAWLAATEEKYLQVAPMKLLLDEVRIWANEIGANCFHLGGGHGADEDSLFRFKTGFSKTLHEFNVWQMIVMAKEYQEISRTKVSWDKEQNREMTRGHFFPLYRRPTI